MVENCNQFYPGFGPLPVKRQSATSNPSREVPLIKPMISLSSFEAI
jgi:hypothetical protein